MPFVGNLTTVRDKDECYKDYHVVQQTANYYSSYRQQTNAAWTALDAEAYVSQLFQEVPDPKVMHHRLRGQLAVVTGVTTNSVGYHVAQELALQAGMHVVLLGRSESKLRQCANDIRAEAAQRGLVDGNNHPINLSLYHECKFHLASLESVREAAQFVEKLALEKYQGKLHVLINHASVGSSQAKLTVDKKIEYNTGCNFVATHYFTKLLIPLLQKAAVVVPATSDDDTSTACYKPRIVFTASMGHALGTKFDPHRLEQHPMEGGAPEGYIVVVDENTIQEYEPPPVDEDEIENESDTTESSKVNQTESDVNQTATTATTLASRWSQTKATFQARTSKIISSKTTATTPSNLEEPPLPDENDAVDDAGNDDSSKSTGSPITTLASRWSQIKAAFQARTISASSSPSKTAPTPSLEEAVAARGTQVGRSKMALVADAAYFAQLYPELNFTSHHPGAIYTGYIGGSQNNNGVESFTSLSSSPVEQVARQVVDKIYKEGTKMYNHGKLYLTRLSPSQGARAALRAALDPDFDSFDGDLQHGAYLHSDGNPWTPMAPSASICNPATGQPYRNMVEYGQACHEAAEALVAQIVQESSRQEQQEEEQQANSTTATPSTTAADTMATIVHTNGHEEHHATSPNSVQSASAIMSGEDNRYHDGKGKEEGTEKVVTNHAAPTTEDGSTEAALPVPALAH